MADDVAVSSGRFVGLRLVLVLAGLVMLAVAAMSLLEAERLHGGLAWYAEAAGIDDKPADSPVERVEQAVEKGPSEYPGNPLQTNALGLYLVRLGLVQLAMPGLACFLAAAGPVRRKGLLALLTLYGLLCAAASGVLGYAAGVHLLLYGVPTLAALLYSVLLLALFPYGYGVEQR